MFPYDSICEQRLCGTKDENYFEINKIFMIGFKKVSKVEVFEFLRPILSCKS